MIIKSVVIKNFRSLVELGNFKKPFDLGQSNNVIIGLNGSGKSNLLKAFNLFFNNRISSDENWDF